MNDLPVPEPLSQADLKYAVLERSGKFDLQWKEKPRTKHGYLGDLLLVCSLTNKTEVRYIDPYSGKEVLFTVSENAQKARFAIDIPEFEAALATCIREV